MGQKQGRGIHNSPPLPSFSQAEGADAPDRAATPRLTRGKANVRIVIGEPACHHSDGMPRVSKRGRQIARELRYRNEIGVKGLVEY